MSRRAKIIAIFNQKGGVGKTATVANLAMELKERGDDAGTEKTQTVANLARELNSRGKRVLMIDADQQENLSVSFGVMPSRCKATLYTLLCAEIYDRPYKKDLSGVIVHTDYGVDLIPGLDKYPQPGQLPHFVPLRPGLPVQPVYHVLQLIQQRRFLNTDHRQSISPLSSVLVPAFCGFRIRCHLLLPDY